jgi:hypothetical protein
MSSKNSREVLITPSDERDPAHSRYYTHALRALVLDRYLPLFGQFSFTSGWLLRNVTKRWIQVPWCVLMNRNV